MQSQLYLITGFLGAGKTTFLKELVRALAGRRLRLIVNEFGREGVDGVLLRETGAALSEISNGSIFCACRMDQFEQALQSALDAAPDCVLVEASGLSDPSSLRRLLREPPFAGRVDYRGGICLVDAVRFEKVYATARCCKKQLAAADLLLLNKADLASPESLARVEALLRAQRPDLTVHRTVRGAFDPAWLPRAGPGEVPDIPPGAPDLTLQRHTLGVSPSCARDQLLRALGILGEDSHRVKGFVQLREGLYLADCVGSLLSLEPWSGGTEHVGRLQVLAGQGLPVGRSIRSVQALYPGLFTLLP